MAARRRDGLPGGAVDGLSVEAAHCYARAYAAARAGCMSELRRAGCGEQEAEEIFSATLERIMRRRDPVAEGFGPAETVALLKRACLQKLIDEHRHRDVLQIVPLEEELVGSDRTSQSLTEAAEDREAVAVGREAISSLPERDRRLFLQRHRLGLAPEEVLRRNPGLTRRTYRKVIQRANARALAAFGEIDSGRRCAELRGEQLRRYVAEEASEAELRTIRAHLLHCRACGQEVARMRGHLHEVATGLAALLTEEQARGHLLGELPARLLEAAGSGGEALAGATRAARERLREMAVRAASALPGSGGEGAAGQIAGISAAKAASVCAAGALAAGCLAAGVVPGVGGLEAVSKKQSPRHSKPARDVESPPLPPPEAPPASGASASPESSAKSGTEEDAQRAASSEPRSARPRTSGEQTGAEFGAEATGTGTPIPSRSSGSGGASSGGGTGGGPGASGGGYESEPEFGF